MVWVIVYIAHNHLKTSLDHLFDDLLQDDMPSGGKLVFMSGYFMHNLHIILGGSEAQITNVFLRRNPL
jgi:hypothetical protein